MGWRNRVGRSGENWKKEQWGEVRRIGRKSSREKWGGVEINGGGWGEMGGK